MNRARFDGLRVVQRARECRSGTVELCRGADGTDQIRLRLEKAACQHDILAALDASIPTRLEQGALEVLLPYQDGASLREWLYERRPGLGQRRDACLSLLAQVIGDRLPACLVAPCATADNLRFSDTGAVLQYLPDLMCWRPGLAEADAVRAVAGLVREVLTSGARGRERSRYPEELRLLCLRADRADYLDWGQLQRDVSALPDTLLPVGAAGRTLWRRVGRLTARLVKPAVCVVAALLLVAAALSLVSAYRGWKNAEQNAWPGMTPIGNEELRQEQEVPG